MISDTIFMFQVFNSVEKAAQLEYVVKSSKMFHDLLKVPTRLLGYRYAEEGVTAPNLME